MINEKLFKLYEINREYFNAERVEAQNAALKKMARIVMSLEKEMLYQIPSKFLLPKNGHIPCSDSKNFLRLGVKKGKLPQKGEVV